MWEGQVLLTSKLSSIVQNTCQCIMPVTDCQDLMSDECEQLANQQCQGPKKRQLLAKHRSVSRDDRHLLPGNRGGE